MGRFGDAGASRGGAILGPPRYTLRESDRDPIHHESPDALDALLPARHTRARRSPATGRRPCIASAWLKGAQGPMTAQEVADAVGQHHTSVRPSSSRGSRAAGVVEGATDPPRGRGRPVRRYPLASDPGDREAIGHRELVRLLMGLVRQTGFGPEEMERFGEGQGWTVPAGRGAASGSCTRCSRAWGSRHARYGPARLAGRPHPRPLPLRRRRGGPGWRSDLRAAPRAGARHRRPRRAGGHGHRARGRGPPPRRMPAVPVGPAGAHMPSLSRWCVRTALAYLVAGMAIGSSMLIRQAKAARPRRAVARAAHPSAARRLPAARHLRRRLLGSRRSPGSARAPRSGGWRSPCSTRAAPAARGAADRQAAGPPVGRAAGPRRGTPGPRRPRVRGPSGGAWRRNLLPRRRGAARRPNRKTR